MSKISTFSNNVQSNFFFFFFSFPIACPHSFPVQTSNQIKAHVVKHSSDMCAKVDNPMLMISRMSYMNHGLCLFMGKYARSIHTLWPLFTFTVQQALWSREVHEHLGGMDKSSTWEWCLYYRDNCNRFIYWWSVGLKLFGVFYPLEGWVMIV